MTKRIDPEENLVKLFGSISRARILSFLYAFEGQSFYQRGIVRPFSNRHGLKAKERDSGRPSRRQW
jgi:hypothetical protein